MHPIGKRGARSYKETMDQFDQFDQGGLPEDLRQIAARLEHERPRLTAEQLDRVRAQARPARPTYFPRKKGLLMKPRLAVTLTLTLGLVFSGTGATLAVITDGDSAGIAQYPTAPVGGQQVPPAQEVGPVQEIAPEVIEEVAPEEEDVGGITEEEGGVRGVVERERQVTAAGAEGELPFTGILAIPLLIAGLVLLISGVVLRRTARRPPA
jgi:hypothetical protein